MPFQLPRGGSAHLHKSTRPPFSPVRHRVSKQTARRLSERPLQGRLPEAGRVFIRARNTQKATHYTRKSGSRESQRRGGRDRQEVGEEALFSVELVRVQLTKRDGSSTREQTVVCKHFI